MSKWVIGKYIRLSQADRDLRGNENKVESESISHQKALIANFISGAADLKDCRQYEFFDDGYSGTNFDRPGFERMMDLIRKGEINCVIVKDFSRFGRDYIELGDYLERIFPFMGVRFISVNDHYDSLDYKGTTGGLDVVMKNIVYAYYSKDLSVKMKTAKYQKMKQGKYLGGHVPYGLRKDPEDKHKLVIDPEAAAVVREIFDMAIEGERLVDIIRSLNDRGIETPGAYYRRKHPESAKFGKASKKSCWNHTNLRRVLQQEMYYGAVAGHKRQGLDVGCKHTEAVPKEEQFIVEGMHEGIVTKEEFLKAQEIFRPNGAPQCGAKGNYPLFRKVRCGVCGRAMVHKEYQYRKTFYYYFGCQYATVQNGAGACSRKYMKEPDLNAVVWEAVRKLLDLTDAFQHKVEAQRAEGMENNRKLAEKLAGLQREKERCESERFSNVDQFMAGNLDKDVYQRRRAELGRKAERLDAEMEAAAEELRKAETAGDEETVKALDVMKKFAGAEELTQELVQALIEKVVVTDPEHVEVKWKFGDEVLRMIMG